jgi:hypothetical protein
MASKIFIQIATDLWNIISLDDSFHNIQECCDNKNIFNLIKQAWDLRNSIITDGVDYTEEFQNIVINHWKSLNPAKEMEFLTNCDYLIRFEDIYLISQNESVINWINEYKYNHIKDALLYDERLLNNLLSIREKTELDYRKIKKIYTEAYLEDPQHSINPDSPDGIIMMAEEEANAIYLDENL